MVSREAVRRGVLASVVAALLFAGVPAVLFHGSLDVRAVYPTFGPNVLVDDSTGFVQTPDVAVDSNGILHVVWTDRRSGEDDLYYSRSVNSGTSWSASVRIDNTAAARAARDPSIGVSSGSPARVYVVWKDQPAIGHEIMSVTSPDGGLSWNAAVRIDAGGAATTYKNDAVVTVDSGGKVYAAWEDRRNATNPYQVWGAVSTDQGASWGTNFQISEADWTTDGDVIHEPSIAASGTDAVAVTWDVESTTPGLWSIRVANTSNAGGFWRQNAITSVVSTSGTVTIPDIAAAAGALHVTWKDTSAGYAQVRYARSDNDGSTWTPTTRIDDTPSSFNANPTDPKVTMIGASPYSVWADQRSLDFGLYASGSDDGGVTWGDGVMDNVNDARVDDDIWAVYQQRPAIASQAFGLYAVWEDQRNTPNNDVYFARYVISDVVLSEIRDSPDLQEYVEIANFGGLNTDFTGWTLNVDGTVHNLSALGVVPAMGHRTVGRVGNLAVNVQLAGFILGDQGGSLVLSSPTGVIDSIGYGQRGVAPDPLGGAGESSARCYDGNLYRDEWSRDPTGTPGALNNAPCVDPNPDLILNEVFFQSSAPGGTNRFIELYYRGAGTLNPNNYVLVSNIPYTISTGVTLSPTNPYLAITQPTASLLFGQILVPGENIYLYNNTGQLLDMVGWDTPKTVDESLCRVPSGFGTFQGFDDPTSASAGWAMGGCTPSMPLVTLAPAQRKFADPGQTINFTLTATNKQVAGDTIDITTVDSPNPGFVIGIYNALNTAPLTDTDGDLIPDVGNLSWEANAKLNIRVTVPAIPPANSYQYVDVTGHSSNTALGSDTVRLTVLLYPYLEVDRTLVPSTVDLQGSGGAEFAQVTLIANARGNPFPRPVPQDMVLMIDSSGSMATNDPNNDRITAAQLYISLMNTPDRVAILDFDSTCRFTGPDHHLNTLGHDGVPNWNDPINDVTQIDSAGGTNLLCPIVDTTTELTTIGDAAHTWAGILLTDGVDSAGNTDAQILQAAITAGGSGIVIFTIGMSAGTNAALLQGIASATGGQFFPAPDPSYLPGIYQAIHDALANVTAVDPRSQALPYSMIEDHLPSYITVVPGTFTLPAFNTVETIPDPDYTLTPPGRTVLQWNVTRISLNNTWAVSFLVTCSLPGTNPVSIVPDARAAYLNWNNTLVLAPFPDRLITCSAPTIVSPTDVTTRWIGGPSNQVQISWTAPGTLPDHYNLYRAVGDPLGFTNFSEPARYAIVSGFATTFTDSLPAGVGEYYYLLRSSDPSGAVLSPTTNTAGVYIGTLNGGGTPTMVSRPLAYFPWVSYAGAEPDTIGEYLAAWGASTISYIDAAGRWAVVPGTGNPNQVLALGMAVMVTRGLPGTFMLTGLPGSHIFFDESATQGFTPAGDARSLAATFLSTDVTLNWLPVAGASGYQIHYSTSRTGIYGAHNSITVAGTTWTFVNALVTPELYYWVVPLGSSAYSYSIGLWTGTYGPLQAIGLPLRPVNPSLIGNHLSSIPSALGVLWLSPTGAWIPHFATMPAGVYDTTALVATGYQLSVRTSATVSYVWIGH